MHYIRKSSIILLIALLSLPFQLLVLPTTVSADHETESAEVSTFTEETSVEEETEEEVVEEYVEEEYVSDEASPATASAEVAPTDAPLSNEEFVSVCGMQLCLNGETFIVHSATAYGQYANAEAETNLAQEANLNTLELVEYEKQWRTLSSATSEETWIQNDQFIANAGAKDLKIILNLSSYGHALAAAGVKPTSHDWNPFLSFVMNRVNTVTGARYADDPTIAKVQLYGEIAAPNYNDPMRGTTQETTAFYQRSLAQLRSLAPNHVISTGGFSYINDQYSGIDWMTIMADPNNQVCDIEINSYGDRNVSLPNVVNHCQGMGKPWFLAAWSACQGMPHFKDDINHWQTDEEMAAHAADMLSLTKYGFETSAIGSSFWNLASTPARQDNCDIGPQYQMTLDVVKNYPSL